MLDYVLFIFSFFPTLIPMDCRSYFSPLSDLLELLLFPSDLAVGSFSPCISIYFSSSPSCCLPSTSHLRSNPNQRQSLAPSTSLANLKPTNTSPARRPPRSSSPELVRHRRYALPIDTYVRPFLSFGLMRDHLIPFQTRHLACHGSQISVHLYRVCFYRS